MLGQAAQSDPQVAGKLELTLDSIECRTDENRWDTLTMHFAHFSVVNISNDTIRYIANSCFYYNHYYLQCGNREFDINPRGGCHFNAHTMYEIPPGESFSRAEDIHAINLESLQEGHQKVVLSIPLVTKIENCFLVDGRDFVKDPVQLVFVGTTKVMSSSINQRAKRRRNRKRK